MALSDLAQRIYLANRRETLLAEQIATYHEGVRAHTQAADLVRSRARRDEIEPLRQVALAAYDRCDRLAHAMRVINAELREDEA